MTAEMRPTTFAVLLALAGGRRHGYSIIQEALALTDGAVALKVPTLYSTLDRLERAGLVANDGDEIVAGKVRRYFRITPDGETAFQTELARIEGVASRARRHLSAIAAAN